MNTETIRTVSPETYKRNIRARLALLTLRSIHRPLTAEEKQELKDLQNKLSQLERS